MANVDSVARKRSASSPSLSIELAAGYVAKLVGSEDASLDSGRNGWSREEALQAMGLNTSSGRSNRYLASMLQYGFLETKDEKLVVTELGRRASRDGRTPEDFAQAFEKVEVFRRVQRALADQPVTEDNCVPLFQKADVFTPDAFDVFEESARQAHLLDASGRFLAKTVELTLVEAKVFRFGVDGEALATVQFFGPISEDTLDYLQGQVEYLCRRQNKQSQLNVKDHDEDGR